MEAQPAPGGHPADGGAAVRGKARELAAVALVLAILAALLALLELRHPYYFLQDDNRTQLGLLADWLRGWRGGEVPLYAFHQYLGMPSFAAGPVALFYFPLYVTAVVSERLLGHFQALDDLVIALHLACGLLGMHRLLRALGLGRAAAAFGALTWPLCSMSVYVSSSWWQVSGVVAYFPWMVLLGLRAAGVLSARSRAASVAGLVVVRTLLLLVGHVQFFVYPCILELLTVAVGVMAAPAGSGAAAGGAGFSGGPAFRRRARALAPYLLSLYLGAALALPFVLPLWHATVLSTDRAAPLAYSAFHDGNYNVISWLAGAVAPYRADPDYYSGPFWLAFERTLPYLSFTGHLTLVLLASVPFLVRRGRIVARLPLRVFALPLAVAFAWMIGGLDRLLHLVPLLNRFRWHFKLNFFVVFFGLVLAAAAFDAGERWLRERLRPRRVTALVATVLALHVGSLALLYLAWPPRTFNYRRMRDRPPLVEPLAARMGTGRIVSLGYLTADPQAVAQLGYDYASLFGVFHYAGYGNLISTAHARHVRGQGDPQGQRPRADGVYKLPEVPFAELERWAVAWYVLGRNAEDPAETAHYEALLARRGLHRVAADSRRIVYHDPRAEPLVYVVAVDGRREGRAPAVGGPEALQPRIGGRSLTVSFRPSSRPRALVACFLAVPGFNAATLDGHALEVRSDGGRLTVDVPAGARGVRFVYDEPGLRRGLLLAAVLTAVPLVVSVGWVGRRRFRRLR